MCYNSAMKRAWVTLIIVVVLCVIICGIWFSMVFLRPQPVGKCDVNQPWPCGMAAIGNKEIWITTPRMANMTVTSPLTVTGFAPGNWYFEASFPVIITDWDGKIIGQSHVQAKDDWTQSGPIRFEGTIEFTAPPCSATYCEKGTLIFKNDNPSGDPSREKSFEVPVIFK